MRILRVKIESLTDWHPWLFVEPHVVACVATLSRYGESPASVHVDCTDIDSSWLADDTQFALEVSWSPATAEKAERFRSTVQAKPLLEMASTALALSISHRVLRLGQLDVTDYGERTDYRSTKIPCMLEISGTETLSELGRRHREKVKQAIANPLGWNSYVIVCGFSSERHEIRLSYHEA